MKKTIANIALCLESGIKREPVSGFAFEYCGLSLAVHKQPGGKLWGVTEVTTGFSVCKDSKTRAAAIDKARDVLDRQSPERINHALASARQALSGKPAPRKPANGKPAAKARKRKSDIYPLSHEAVMSAMEEDNGAGFCLACGNEQMGCEPDARNYTCEACGARKVFGAEEIILMGAIA